MGARRYQLEVRQHLNGPKKYCVPGREPDTADTLESDGLIKQEGDGLIKQEGKDIVVQRRVLCQEVGHQASYQHFLFGRPQDVRFWG